MTKFEFPTKITSKELDKFYSSSEFLDIEINNFIFPSELRYQGFGIVPLAILTFFCWLRNNKTGKIIIKVNIDDVEALKNFSSDFLGYTILSSAWKHKEIVNEELVQLKGSFKKYTQLLHKRIDFLQELPNDTILIPLFDHYSKQQGLSHWFYNSDFNFIGSPEELFSTTYRIFSDLGKIYKTKLAQNLNPVLEDLQIIMWELVKNTHDHATKDYLNQVDLAPNTRGIYLKIHRSSKRNFITKSKEDSGLKNYFENVLYEGENFMLEISVFDTGPGIVKRFLGKEWMDSVSPNQEVDTIKKCLCKGISSTEGLRGNNRGFGLNNALITLSKRQGYLKIRTGNVSIYRDLLKSPHFETVDYEKITLQDVVTNSPSQFSGVGDTVGTLITMFFPLK